MIRIYKYWPFEQTQKTIYHDIKVIIRLTSKFIV